jgi:CheY-like chemotaxis protein
MAVSDPPSILWRLRGHGRDVRCLRQRSGDGYELRVLWGQQLFLTESFHDDARLLERAEVFRQGLLSRGWQPLALDSSVSTEAGDLDDMVIGLAPGMDEAAYLAELDRLSPPDLARRPTVLAVDDEPSVRNFLRSYLEQAGYAVCEAGTIEDALDALDRSPVDAVVLDVRMPDPTGFGRSGLEVLTYMRLHAAFAAIPVVVVTGHSLDPVEESLLVQHRADLFRKPDGYRLLLQRLDQLTGRREVARP